MDLHKAFRVGRDVLVVALCVAGAFLLAYQTSFDTQRSRAEFMATVVLDRTALTTEQLASAYKRMEVFPGAEACTPAAQSLMRQIDVSSSLLQGIGYIENNMLLCSSLGEPNAVAVGTADYVSATNTTFRRQRDLSIAPGFPLLLVSGASGYTGLIHPSLIFNLTNAGHDLPSGVVSYSTRERIISSDEDAPVWIGVDLPSNQYSGTLAMGDQLVAWERSRKWDHFTYAALPFAAVNAEFQRQSWLFAPLGIVIGLAVVFVMRRVIASRASLPTLLKAGLRRNEILTVYQPIVDMRTGRWVGAEVLARWKRPNGEWVSPEVFVPIAERHGLVPQLTQTVLSRCYADLGVFIATHPDFFVSINISSADLRQLNFVSGLAAACASRDIAAQSVHLEITERSEVDAEAEVPTIEALRAQGFRVGIDDFGIGYSNLAYLDLLHVDYLKIDRAFVAAISRGGRLGTQVVDHIIELASGRGLTLIAEGVEREDQRAELLSRGVRFGQGWLFGKPMSRLDFVAGYAASLDQGSPTEPKLARVA